MSGPSVTIAAGAGARTHAALANLSGAVSAFPPEVREKFAAFAAEQQRRSEPMRRARASLRASIERRERHLAATRGIVARRPARRPQRTAAHTHGRRERRPATVARRSRRTAAARGPSSSRGDDGPPPATRRHSAHPATGAGR